MFDDLYCFEGGRKEGRKEGRKGLWVDLPVVTAQHSTALWSVDSLYIVGKVCWAACFGQAGWEGMALSERRGHCYGMDV
jgi:hypothetical protein